MRHVCEKQAGTTLLELLIALVVMTAVALTLFEGLDAGSRYTARSFTETSHGDDVTRTQELLRTLIGRMQPPGPRGGIEVIGTETSLTFAAPIDRTGIRDPLYRVRLERAGNGEELVLSYAHRHLARPGGATPAETTEVQLIDGIAKLSISYWTTDTDRNVVRRDSWTHRNELPERISIDVAFADASRSWPTLVVRPLIDHNFSCSFDVSMKGCR